MARKGETISLEMKVKFRETRQINLSSKYKWEIAEPFFDVQVKNGCGKRTNEFITLREFKTFICNGASLLEIANRGISKHLVQFFSIFCQDKIKLTKDIFTSEYESGKSLEEMADAYNLSRENITYLRELYNIKRKGSAFINRKLTEIPLTDTQKAILYGSMLGDAKKMSPSSAGFGHSDKQKEYLLWKFEQFKSVVSERSLTGTPYKDKRSGYEGMSWRFYTKANTDVETCMQRFYRNGTKDVYQDILSELNELSLAVWFMDDGKTDFYYRTKYNNKPTAELCTESFSFNGCNLLVSWLKDRFDIESYLRERKLSDSTGHRIVFNTDNAPKLFQIISPHIIPSMRYKVDSDSYMQWRTQSQPTSSSKHRLMVVGSCFTELPKKQQDEIVAEHIELYSDRSIESLLVKPSHLKQQMHKVMSYDTSKLLFEDYIGFCNIGNEFLMSHFPHFWSAKAKGNMSPSEILKNKSYLDEIIRGLIINGEKPNSRAILRKLKRYRGNKSISGFMPCVAKAVYDKYCNHSKVLDFCSGYGGRLMGATASNKVFSYTGIDANFKSFKSANVLYNNLCDWADITKTVTLFNADSIECMKQFADKTFDFCFTSPPYFNAEEYDCASGQSVKQYTQYGEWFNSFLCESILGAIRVSKTVAINVDNTGSYKIADDLEKFLTSKNLLKSKDYLRRPQYGKTAKKEPLFIIGA